MTAGPLHQTPDTTLRHNLCLKFCAYYKPGKNEELACRGYEIVDRLVQQGRKVLVEKRSKRPERNTWMTLKAGICNTCDFHEQDCDFMQDPSAPPCGGFVALAQLLESGEITLAEITEGPA